MGTAFESEILTLCSDLVLVALRTIQQVLYCCKFATYTQFSNVNLYDGLAFEHLLIAFTFGIVTYNLK